MLVVLAFFYHSRHFVKSYVRATRDLHSSTPAPRNISTEFTHFGTLRAGSTRRVKWWSLFRENMLTCFVITDVF